MAFGIALVVVFVLYLIDKHNRWRIAAKVALSLIGLVLLGLGGLYGWTKYTENRTATTHKREVQDCIARQSSAGAQNIFVIEAAQRACDIDPSYNTQASQPPCLSRPSVNGGLQFDENNLKDLNGKPLPRDPNIPCFPLAQQPWGAHGPTKVYQFEGKRYEVPSDASLDELDKVIRIVSTDSDYWQALPDNQKAYLWYVVETNRQHK